MLGVSEAVRDTGESSVMVLEGVQSGWRVGCVVYVGCGQDNNGRWGFVEYV